MPLMFLSKVNKNYVTAIVGPNDFTVWLKHFLNKCLLKALDKRQSYFYLTRELLAMQTQCSTC